MSVLLREEKHMKNTAKKWIALALVLVLALGMFFIWRNNQPAAQEGSKEVTLEVVDSKGETKTYSVKTDAEYLSQLMDEVQKSGDFSYEGSVGDYGLFIETVNGETADYSVDQSYWAIYVNGDMGQYGADTQPVEDGGVYRLAYEK